MFKVKKILFRTITLSKRDNKRKEEEMIEGRLYKKNRPGRTGAILRLLPFKILLTSRGQIL